MERTRKKIKKNTVIEKKGINVDRVMEAAGLLKDSLVDEQAAEIERLKSAENALAYKDKVIERIKKKNAKRMSEKCEVIAVLNKEIVFQYKRREKAEKFVNTLGQAFDLLKKNVEDYEHSIGR